jgi:hypothetical protein
MITPSRRMNLGKDTLRMRNPDDVIRQTRTVERLLERFTADQAEDRRLFQVLADEVGMGKTFVALGTAFSLLEALREGATHEDLHGVVPKVLVVSPPSATLFQKWQGEVQEFVSRAVRPEHKVQAESWFHRPEHAPRHWDDVVAELRRDGGPAVVVTQMDAFGRALRYDDEKMRAMLLALFRVWGNKFPVESREVLLRGRPQSWPGDPSALSSSVRGLKPFGEDELVTALRRMADWGWMQKEVADALATAKDLATPYRRGRSEDFGRLLKQIRDLYRPTVSALLPCLPLVIVDEAHNWKAMNNGARPFMKWCAPWTRRLLMLSATPFQLHPTELLRLFEVAECVWGSPDPSRREALSARVRHARTTTIASVLASATDASIDLSSRWRTLSESGAVTTPALERLWDDVALVAARKKLRDLALADGAVSRPIVQALAREAVNPITHADARPFLRSALELFAYNRDLSQELGEYVVRHRRPALHRRVLVGAETVDPLLADGRPDRHMLHAAPGIEVEGPAELAHFVLMRCVQAAKAAGVGAGTTALGTAITGCWSTLFDSAEGRLLDQLPAGSQAELYGDMLRSLVGPDSAGDSAADEHHPKMASTIRTVREAWRRGEKVLLFCSRTKTARRLEALLNKALEQEIDAREALLGGPDRIRQLRAGLTGRDRPMIGIGLDSVLRSYHRAHGLPFDPATLLLSDDEVRTLAKLMVRAGLRDDGDGSRVDRVFLHRAVEHLVARRLLATKPLPLLVPLLDQIADEAWVRAAYGVAVGATTEDGDDEHDRAHERGVSAVYELRPEVGDDEVHRLANLLVERRVRARAQRRTPLLDTVAVGPSLWFDGNESWQKAFHQHLWTLSSGDSGSDSWTDRAKVFGALRKVLRWRELLVRMVPNAEERDDDAWADVLVRAAHTPTPGQIESVADRLLVFLEDLASASGRLGESASMRGSIFSATRQAARAPVALIDGDVQGPTRAGRFAGFNSPLPPEILVCTSVGQEGIDLHRHCRHVVHYDLDWNPAVIEQRTGRVDRIGSKTFRDRERDPGVLLDVRVPYLAGTYDERMYEELRLRAQAFEILTGGEFSKSGDRSGLETADASEAPPESSHSLVPLPETMVRDLQVRMDVASSAAAIPTAGWPA